MATATSAGAALHGGPPDEIIIWEILVRLPSKSLLRCRSVCRDWRGAISSADFLLAHHRRQPSLPIVSGYEYGDSLYENFHVFDHQAVGAELQPLVQLHDSTAEASCDGLLIISMRDVNDTVTNYNVRPENKLVVVFDTTLESFRQMRAPVVPAKSYIFEMDDTLGFYNCSNDRAIVDIWVLQNYESEVWHHEYRVELPGAEIKGRFGRLDDSSVVCVVSVAGDILLLVSIGGSMFYVDVDGKLVDNFYHDDQILYSCELRLKQTLVSHNFFTTLEGYAVNVSPFV
ncbi:unnamed protein product [Alopecurus aequalis]